jgi:hypothetical protein
MRVQAMEYDMNGDALCIVCRHVTDGVPIMEVAHDRDGVVQLLCASYEHGAHDAHTVHLSHMISVLDALELPKIDPGQYAQLSEAGLTVLQMPPEEEEA